MEVWVCEKGCQARKERVTRGTCLFSALGVGFDRFSTPLVVSQDIDEETNRPMILLGMPDDLDGGASRSQTGREAHATLGHALLCPAMHMKQQGIAYVPNPDKPNDTDVAVACCMVLERRNPDSGEPEVLITRRHPKMRAFPFIWVFPGGHIDPGEQLWEAGVRELREECGVSLALAEGRQSLQLLGFWESAYPSRLTAGPLRKQHLVAFFYYQLQEDPDLRLCPVEVDAAAWLSLDAAAAVLSAFKDRGTVPMDVPILNELLDQHRKHSGDYAPASTTFAGTALVDANASHEDREVEWCKKTFNVQENLAGEDVTPGKERMSTATLFMLSLWFHKTMQSRENAQKKRAASAL